MKKASMILILTFMCARLPFTGCMAEMQEQVLHQYLEIPFKGTTREEVAQILSKKTGVPIEALDEAFVIMATLMGS